MKNTIGKEFMRKTQHPYQNESDQQKGMKQPPIEYPYDKEKQLIELPDPSTCKLKEEDISKLINNRQSLRKYENEAITRIELSYLLWSTQGIKKEVKGENGNRTLRTVPSAGARHPFETYLLINHVEGLTSGIYRYIATKHKLLKVVESDTIAKDIMEACLGQIYIEKSAVTFIWAVDIYRTKWRYDERSYRYVLLDAGHVCQNLYLSAESIKAGVCAVASFDDERLNQLLNLDGENQFVVYLATLGKR